MSEDYANFRVKCQGVSGGELAGLLSALQTYTGYKYGYLATKLVDVWVVEFEATLCGKKRVKKSDLPVIRAYVLGWFRGRQLGMYHFEFVST